MQVALEFLEDHVAVELGHQHVEQHQVKAPRAQQLERFSPVLGEDDVVPLVLEPTGEQQLVDPIVIRLLGVANPRRVGLHRQDTDRAPLVPRERDPQPVDARGTQQLHLAELDQLGDPLAREML